MSVLVKGMKMPKHCAECGFLETEYTLECNCLRKIMQGIFEGRDRDCPLVEVHTPHGRLCDADAVKECLDDAHDCQDKEWALMLLEWAVEKRTVIEAEDE